MREPIDRAKILGRLQRVATTIRARLGKELVSSLAGGFGLHLHDVVPWTGRRQNDVKMGFDAGGHPFRRLGDAIVVRVLKDR